jgi:hypothetical protein
VRGVDGHARAAVLGVLLPPLIWSAHFIGAYIIGAMACGERSIISAPMSMAGILILTALCFFGIVVSSFSAFQRDEGRPLRAAGAWSAIISATAVLAGGLPTLLLPGCDLSGG